MRRDPITPFFGGTGLHSIFSKFKQSIQTIQHDGYVKMCLQIKFYIFLIFILFIKMGTKIQWSEYIDFVKYLINSKKIRKNIKFDLQAHFNITIMLNGLD